MDKYAISPTDPWTWQLARHEDVEDILDLVHQNYEHERSEEHTSELQSH